MPQVTEEEEATLEVEPLVPVPRVLLVDDSESIREPLSRLLTLKGFEVVEARNVNEALRCIAAGTFDVLLSDLHMPAAGDGLTVVSAMRHSNPKAVTLIFSAFPAMEKAAAAILLQADEVMVKPLAGDMLVERIWQRLHVGASSKRDVQSVGAILERETQTTIDDWMRRVDEEPKVLKVPMYPDMRSIYLHQMFRDLVYRLFHPLPLGTKAHVSPAAAAHGVLRRQQGYTAAMLVEESRMLQVSIFQTLQNNLQKMNFSLLLTDVMTIADEIDSQLAQQMASYVVESETYPLPVTA